MIKVNVTKAANPTLTLINHISDGDASDLRVTKAKQESPTGTLFENQVYVLLPNETKYKPSKTSIANIGHCD